MTLSRITLRESERRARFETCGMAAAAINVERPPSQCARSLPGSSLRNRAPSADRTWPVPTWSATGRCFRAGRPAAATPRRTPDAQSQCHCMQIPEWMRMSYRLVNCILFLKICILFLLIPRDVLGLFITFLHARTIFFRS